MDSDEKLQLRYETVAVGSAFEELLDLAKRACLSPDNTYDDNLEQITQTTDRTEGYRIAQRVGLWPTRHLFDKYVRASRPVDMEGAFRPNQLGGIDPTDFPELPLDEAVQDQIEALGRSLLDEAFICLGDDAEEQVKKFQQAKTPEERMEVGNWLDQRINAFRSPSGTQPGQENEEDLSSYFHHPIKLSPRVIGKYPDIRVMPTCLGVSILMASFCEKTGARYLHGGVAITADKTIRKTQRQLMPMVGRAARSVGGQAPQHALKKFNDAHMMLGHYYEMNRGFHADILLDLGDGNWMQLDPYFKRTTVIKNAEPFEKTYEALNDTGIRGAEAMVFDDMAAKQNFMGPFIKRLVKNMPTVEEVDEFLRVAPPLWADQVIIQQYFGQFFDLDKAYCRPVKNIADQIVAHLQTEDPEIDHESYLWGLVHEAVVDYVFPEAEEDVDITPYVKKCQQDPEYRRQRAEYLRIAPLFAVLKLQSELAETTADHETPQTHTLTEVGLPAYRIGACVLSDLAVYCGNELPFSFWATYWPSHIALSEHLGSVDNAMQAKLGKSVMDMIKLSRLTYSDVYLKVIATSSERSTPLS